MDRCSRDCRGRGLDADQIAESDPRKVLEKDSRARSDLQRGLPAPKLSKCRLQRMDIRERRVDRFLGAVVFRDVIGLRQLVHAGRAVDVDEIAVRALDEAMVHELGLFARCKAEGRQLAAIDVLLGEQDCIDRARVAQGAIAGRGHDLCLPEELGRSAELHKPAGAKACPRS